MSHDWFTCKTLSRATGLRAEILCRSISLWAKMLSREIHNAYSRAISLRAKARKVGLRTKILCRSIGLRANIISCVIHNA